MLFHSTLVIDARLDLDPVRESIDRATSALLIAAGVKESADIIDIKRKTA